MVRIIGSVLFSESAISSPFLEGIGDDVRLKMDAYALIRTVSLAFVKRLLRGGAGDADADSDADCGKHRVNAK